MARRAQAFEIEAGEGAIRVRRHGRTLTIRARAPDADSDEEVDFVVSLDEIEHWDAPDDDVAIDVVELQKILEAIETQLEKRGISVDFD